MLLMQVPSVISVLVEEDARVSAIVVKWLFYAVSYNNMFQKNDSVNVLKTNDWEVILA